MTTYRVPTIIPTETEIAYIAGLFDGEGCVSLYMKENTNGRRYHNLTVSLSNTNVEALEFVQERCGGRLVNNGVGGKGATRDCYALQWTNTQTEDFLSMVQPYAIVKRRAIAVGLAFRETVPPKKGTPRGMPESVVERRNHLHSELAAINGYRIKERR